MTNDPPKILAFAGSLRPESYNKKLIQIAIRGAQNAGGNVTYIDLRDFPLPLYDQVIEDTQGLPQNALKLKDLFSKNEGLMIASPEYNSSFSGVLKNTIDWVSRKATPDEVNLSCFIKKVAILMSASPSYLGGLRGLVHLRSILSNINTLVLPEQKSISTADKAFTSEGNLQNLKDQETVYKLGEKLAEFLKHSPYKIKEDV